MRVLFVSAEVSPFAKVGGLADVAGSLPQALREQGLEVKVVMPAYGLVLNNPKYKVKKIASGVPVWVNQHWPEPADVYTATYNGQEVTLIGCDRWFSGANRSEDVYTPGIHQYLWFSQAVLQVSEALNWRPNRLHCNDWHTGLIPVLAREKRSADWSDVGTVFTIHNLAYQGEFGFELLDWLELSHELWTPNRLETYGSLNFLKAGCAYSDIVTTVSPNYAKEILTPEFGCRLQGLMNYLNDHGKLFGILNGINTEEFEPSTDPHIAAHYSANDLSGKAKCKTALLKEIGLEKNPKEPVVGMVSRLSGQKGMDLVISAAHDLLELPCKLVVLGSGDDWLASEFHRLASRYPERVFFREGFEIELAPKIYAGSDIFLMPSRFEPCGLGQLIAMRYATLPLVRSTGGLKDTVLDGIDGFAFENATVDELIDALARASKAFGDPKKWLKMQNTALQRDVSWTNSAKEYVHLYSQLSNAQAAAAS